LTIEKLKRDGILQHTKLVYLLYNEAVNKQKVMDEIEKIESNIIDCQPKIINSRNPEYPASLLANQ
jgi:hypothetical protein